MNKALKWILGLSTVGGLLAWWYKTRPCCDSCDEGGPCLGLSCAGECPEVDGPGGTNTTIDPSVVPPDPSVFTPPSSPGGGSTPPASPGGPRQCAALGVSVVPASTSQTITRIKGLLGTWKPAWGSASNRKALIKAFQQRANHTAGWQAPSWSNIGVDGITGPCTTVALDLATVADLQGRWTPNETAAVIESAYLYGLTD